MVTSTVGTNHIITPSGFGDHFPAYLLCPEVGKQLYQTVELIEFHTYKLQKIQDFYKAWIKKILGQLAYDHQY